MVLPLRWEVGEDAAGVEDCSHHNGVYQVPFRTHPELAKLFEDLPAPTCTACIFKDSDATYRQALIVIFERRAQKAGYVAHGNCSVCHTSKAVICPNRSA